MQVCGSSLLMGPLLGERQKEIFSATESKLSVIKLKREMWPRSFKNCRKSALQ